MDPSRFSTLFYFSLFNISEIIGLSVGNYRFFTATQMKKIESSLRLNLIINIGADFSDRSLALAVILLRTILK